MVEHSIAIFSSQSIRRDSKDVLEAVFAVNVEAGNGMQQPSSIVRNHGIGNGKFNS